MNSPDTVTQAIALLRAEGYEEEFQLRGGLLRSAGGGRGCAVSEAEVERLYRFEGPSDPGDEMIVFALLDPVTGIRGTLASAFGMSADPEVLDHLVGLSQRQRPT
jgi:hypothetical protein